MSIGLVGKISGDVVIANVKLVPREQDERREIRRPPHSVRRRGGEDMPDGHVIDSQDEFALSWLPDGDSPIADDALEAFRLPAIKGSGDDRNIGGSGVEVAAHFGDELIAIIDAAVPGDDEASASNVW